MKRNKADIRRDGNDIVVADEKDREVYRQPKTAQTVSIAHAIYMCHKYGLQEAVRVTALTSAHCRKAE